jgi:hypothetical protein
MLESVIRALIHEVTTLPESSGEFNQTAVTDEKVDELALK